MKKVVAITVMLLMLVLSAEAQQQQHKRFSPEQFDAELQQFIVQEAHLTPQESARFFPVYKEMQQKQRKLFGQQRRQGKIKPQDEAGCLKAIQEHDNIDVELKRIQQTYHNEFLDILPASKVYDVIKAEDHFHRRMLKRWSKPREKK